MNDDISGLCLKSYLNATCSNTWTFETHAPEVLKSQLNHITCYTVYKQITDYMRDPSLVILEFLVSK